jgi:multidrug efflux pump subunit AcrA (membrane-fusion protein)
VSLVPEKSKSGVFINRKAVLFGTSTIPYIWKMSEKNTVTKTEIKSGRQLGEYIEVTSGLKKGDNYVVIMDHDIVLEEGKDVSEFVEQKVEEEGGEEGHDH